MRFSGRCGATLRFVTGANSEMTNSSGMVLFLLTKVNKTNIMKSAKMEA